MVLAIFLFVIGIFFGSFYNVIIDRLPRGEDFLIGRSHCDFCKHVLSWKDLVPLLSFVLLCGKCRYCKKKLGLKYPIIEIATGILFSFTYIMFQDQPSLFIGILLAIISCLIIIFYTDFFSGIIPDKILFALSFFSVFRLFLLRQSFITFFLTAVVCFILFLLLFLFTRGKGIGFGDVKYAFVMGLLLGFPNIIPALYIAFLTGAFLALILVLLRKKRMKSAIPFGPFLVGGTIITLFYGAGVWAFFQRIIGI